MNKTPNKNLVYTIIIGPYDDLLEPLVTSKDWDYVCFTDNHNLKSDVWEIREIPQKYRKIEDPKRIASLLKIEYYELFSEEYNLVASVDGNILIKKELNMILEKEWGINFSHPWDFVIFEHHERGCVYEEAVAVLGYKLDSRQVVSEHMRRYYQAKYPPNNGQWETGVMLRNNKSRKLKETCKIWAEEYRKGSRRDQLSVNYSFWKADKFGGAPQVIVVPHPSPVGMPLSFGASLQCLDHKSGHQKVRQYIK